MDYDYIIMGSGFGGSVSALRLAEKGYRVLVAEQGRSFRPQDFPKTNWRLKKWFWMPGIGFRGFFRIRFSNSKSFFNSIAKGSSHPIYMRMTLRPLMTIGH